MSTYYKPEIGLFCIKWKESTHSNAEFAPFGLANKNYLLLEQLNAKQ